MRRPKPAALLTAVAALAIVLTACPDGGGGGGGALSITGGAVVSLSGRSTFGVYIEVPGGEPFGDVVVEVDLPDGADYAGAGTPDGAAFAGSKGKKWRWTVSELRGPAIAGPFTLARSGRWQPDSLPKAEVMWKGGKARLDVPGLRESGVAQGYGVLRPDATTAHINIGADTNVAGFILGSAIVAERHVIVGRRPVDPAPPAEITESVTVADFDSNVEPIQNTVLLGMPAPRPLPPYAKISMAKLGEDGSAEAAPGAGRVSGDGFTMFVPAFGTGRFRASIAVGEYRRSLTGLSAVVMGQSTPLLDTVARSAGTMKQEFRKAVEALNSPDVVRLVAAARASSQEDASGRPLPEGLAYEGPATCSAVACVGVPSPLGPVIFCDPHQNLTGCSVVSASGRGGAMPESAPGVLSTDTASLDYCRSHTCFSPGRAVLDMRPNDQIIADPLSLYVSGEEMLWIGSSIAA